MRKVHKALGQALTVLVILFIVLVLLFAAAWNDCQSGFPC